VLLAEEEEGKETAVLPPIRAVAGRLLLRLVRAVAGRRVIRRRPHSPAKAVGGWLLLLLPPPRRVCVTAVGAVCAKEGGRELATRVSTRQCSGSSNQGQCLRSKAESQVSLIRMYTDEIKNIAVMINYMYTNDASLYEQCQTTCFIVNYNMNK
jgi:hypothetical protein